MSNEQHIGWLMEGVKAWNARREREDFVPDFEGADFPRIFYSAGKLSPKGTFNLLGANLSDANLFGANLTRAILRGAYLNRAHFGKADLTEANLEHSSIGGCDFRSAKLTGCNFERCNALTLIGPETHLSTDFRETSSLTQKQLNAMHGDSETRLPDHLRHPATWLNVSQFELDLETFGGEKSGGIERIDHSPIRFTPPAEFSAKDWQLSVQYFPQSPEPRQASATPVDSVKEAANRLALAQLVGTFCSALRKYKREDAELSNRVRPAEQLLVTGEALRKALKADGEDFLPILMEDYIETLALGLDEDVQAFEANDIALYQRIIQRGRQLYAFYPELEEISDPTNTRFIPDDFPYSLDQLATEVKDIVFSEEGLTHFSDTTRELIQAEINATVPRDQDEEKTKLARLGAIVGEMRREMVKYTDKAQSAIDKGASWVKSFEKVEKIWDAIKPFIGMDGGG